jgi:NAD(P)-dependent dehydrogenase (short-subunit alcohol dehydrogenase family)
MVECLTARSDIRSIHATCHRTAPPPVGDHSGGFDGSRRDGARPDIHWTSVDATDETALRAWLDSLGAIDWLINCVGMLHQPSQGPEKTIQSVDADHFRRSMDLNCLPTLLLAKHARKALAQSPAGVFATLSARVGSISDNRLGGWYSYRASKAALNMVLKSLAIEWARNAKNIRVVALHPGTTDTPLSRPFQQNVPAGKLFPPSRSASMLIEQLDRLHDHPSGRFIAYDGEEIPW